MTAVNILLYLLHFFPMPALSKVNHIHHDVFLFKNLKLGSLMFYSLLGTWEAFDK